MPARVARDAGGRILLPMGKACIRWTAILVLALTSMAASATVCATLCAPQHGVPASMAMADCDDMAMPADCPLAQLCEFAAIPAVLDAVSTPDVASPGYVAPLTPPRFYQSDAEPPVKPPAI